MAGDQDLDRGDRLLISIVDAAMAEAARKSGEWLVCRPGCTSCCMGPFAITQLDARRLRQGLAELEVRDPDRARQVRERTAEYLRRFGPSFPGDPVTGILDPSPEGDRRFETYASEEPCPALDPATGRCELYSARPLTCRTFGPPVRFGENSLAVCELCFDGAADEQIAACEVEVDPDGVEAMLLEELAQTNGATGDTIVAYALSRSPEKL